MSNNSNIELVKKLLQKAGVVIHPKSEGFMVYALPSMETDTVKLEPNQLQTKVSYCLPFR